MEMVAMFMAGVVCGMFLAFVGYMMHELFKLDDKVDPYNDYCAQDQQVRMLREAIRKGAYMVVKKKDGTYGVGGNGYSRFEDALEDATIDALRALKGGEANG